MKWESNGTQEGTLANTDGRLKRTHWGVLRMHGKRVAESTRKDMLMGKVQGAYGVTRDKTHEKLK